MVSSIYDKDPPTISPSQSVDVKSNGSEIFFAVCLVLFTLFSSCNGERSNYSHFLKAAYDYDTKDPANK